MKFSDYIVYVDESGSANPAAIDPDYPVFVLSCCLFHIDTYVSNIVPEVQRFKFKYFGHDMVVLHEHEIRKSAGEFNILLNPATRQNFMADFNALVTNAEFTIISSVINKQGLTDKGIKEDPYHLAVQFCLERLAMRLNSLGQKGCLTHVVFERRGKNEDRDLELEFRRVCDGANFRGLKLPFKCVFADKKVISTGLQLADLTARPIGLRVLRPDQTNRAFDIIQEKLDKSPKGEMFGWGIKTFY